MLAIDLTPIFGGRPGRELTVSSLDAHPNPDIVKPRRSSTESSQLAASTASLDSPTTVA